MSWQWGVLHWLVEHSYDFCDFFSSPVSRVVTWSQPPVNIHELDHVDHDCLISLRSLGATTPFQVDAMPLTYHLSINASPNFNIISSFKHHSAPRWMTWIHPKKINHRTWFLMLGKMIFLFQGKNFLRFQPLSFRGDTHVMLSFPFWPSAVNVLVCTRLPWLFGSNKNFNKHRETPKHMTSRKQQKERLNYPGPMIFKWYLYIPLFIFTIIYISIYQHVESSNTAITWANWPKESPTLCWCRAGFAQAIVAAGSNLTLGEYRDEYDDHQLISLVIGATFPWICHDPGTLKLT